MPWMVRSFALFVGSVGQSVLRSCGLSFVPSMVGWFVSLFLRLIVP